MLNFITNPDVYWVITLAWVSFAAGFVHGVAIFLYG